MQRTLPLLLVFSFGFPMRHLGAGEPEMKIGVFDATAAGGQGACADGLIRGLNERAYKAEAIADLSRITLLQYDVVYLCDVQRMDEGSRGEIEEYVRDGGSVLQVWHHHILGQVGTGVLRISNKRRMVIQPGHPAVEGVKDFDASHKDHIVEKVGPAGTVLIKNDTGQPVAVAGKIGKGKVISAGLALGIPDGYTAQWPSGEEEKALKSFLAWLAPDVPRKERLAEFLKEARLVVTPPKRWSPAGLPAAFLVRVAPGEAGGRAQLECEGAEVVARQAVALTDGPEGRVEAFDLSVRTVRGEDRSTKHTVRARVGDKELVETVEVASVDGPPREKELRAVVLHVGQDRHPKAVMPELKELGINLVIMHMGGGTMALFSGSKVQPDVRDPLGPGGDWLAEAVKCAHESGIEIYPYLNNCIVQAKTESAKQLRQAGRLQVGLEGEEIEWFCPSQEVNLEHIEAGMVEIATKYAVDGVMYDFIRYPAGPEGCFCPKCRALFEKETGKAVSSWPKDVGKDGGRRGEWVEFRCRRISGLVKRTSTRIRSQAPNVKIGAAVFANWPQCRDEIGQDWVRWCKEGWLDLVCPMNYTPDSERFAELAAAHRAALPDGFPICQGIGIVTPPDWVAASKDPVALALQIALARKHGAVGWFGYRYVPKGTHNLLAPLKEWMGLN